MEPLSLDHLHHRTPEAAPADLRQPVETRIENSEIVQAVKRLNEAELLGEGREMRFKIDRKDQRAIVRVIDKDSGEVVRQLPPEYVVAVSKELARLKEQYSASDEREGEIKLADLEVLEE